VTEIPTRDWIIHWGDWIILQNKYGLNHSLVDYDLRYSLELYEYTCETQSASH
jgi:hypothetical protein